MGTEYGKHYRAVLIRGNIYYLANFKFEDAHQAKAWVLDEKTPKYQGQFGSFYLLEMEDNNVLKLRFFDKDGILTSGWESAGDRVWLKKLPLKKGINQFRESVAVAT